MKTHEKKDAEKAVAANAIRKEKMIGPLFSICLVLSFPLWAVLQSFLPEELLRIDKKVVSVILLLIIAYLVMQVIRRIWLNKLPTSSKWRIYLD